MRSCFEMKKWFKTVAGERFGSDLEKTGLKTLEVLQNVFCHFGSIFGVENRNISLGLRSKVGFSKNVTFSICVIFGSSKFGNDYFCNAFDAFGKGRGANRSLKIVVTYSWDANMSI